MANPNGTREETLLALDLYLRTRPKLLDDTHEDVAALSRLLQRYAHSRGVTGDASFRNPIGVAMKLANLSSHDPNGPPGRKGLEQGAKGMEAAVWREFDGRAEALAEEVARIRASLGNREPDEQDLSALLSRPPRIFGTGMWGFCPGRDGYVGFSLQTVRDRYVADYEAGDLMLIVGQRGEFSETRDVGRVLGLVDLEPIPIHERERLSPESYQERVARFGPDRWRFAMPIARA